MKSKKMKEIFKKLKNERMTDAEKLMVLNHLETFISQNPVQTPWYKNIASPFYSGIFMEHKVLATVFAIVLIVGGAGGTSFVANESIPGDTLYPIKINLNEKVETFAAFGTEAKAEIEAKHIDERLVEAEVLTNTNELEEKRQIEIQNQLVLDIQKTMNRVDQIKSSGNSASANKIKSNIEKSLQKHKDVVQKIFNTKSKTNNKNQKQVAAPKTSNQTKSNPGAGAATNTKSPETSQTSSFSLMMEATTSADVATSTVNATTTITVKSTTTISTTTKSTSSSQAKESKNYNYNDRDSDKDETGDETPLLDETLEIISNHKYWRGN